MSAESGKERELRAEVLIEASALQVWAVLTDFRALAEASPELVAMVPLKPGGLRPGQWYVGINRRKALVWPTRNVITHVEAGRRLAWVTPTTGVQWIYELESQGSATKVTERRPVTRHLSLLSNLFAGTFLGGGESHADELEEGMQATLEHLKQTVEATR